MPLTERETFKVAFLAKCAADGLSPEETHELVKLALDIPVVSDISKGLVDFGKTVAGKGSTAAGIAALGLPIALGAGAGLTAAKVTDLNDISVDEVKKNELIDELRRATERARLQQRLKQRKDALGSRPVRSYGL